MKIWEKHLKSTNTYLISINHNSFNSTGIIKRSILDGNRQCIILNRCILLCLQMHNNRKDEKQKLEWKGVEKVNTAKLSGNGRSETEWESEVMAFCCWSVKGAFCRQRNKDELVRSDLIWSDLNDDGRKKTRSTRITCSQVVVKL